MLANADVRPGAVQIHVVPGAFQTHVAPGALQAHIAPGAMQARMEEGAVRAEVLTTAEANVLGVQEGGIQLTGLEKGAIRLAATGIESGAICATGISAGGVRALGMEAGAVRVTGAETGAFRVNTNMNITTDSFCMMVISLSAVALAMVAIVFNNLPMSPYPWAFLSFFFALVVAVFMWYKNTEQDKTRMLSNQQVQLKMLEIIFEEQRLRYQMVHSQYQGTNDTTVTQRILGHMERDFSNLLQVYKGCYYMIQRSRDATVYETSQTTLIKTARTFGEKMTEYENEIRQWAIEGSRKQLQVEMDTKAQPFRQKCQDLLQNWKSKYLAGRVRRLSGEFENLYDCTQVKVRTMEEELQLVRIGAEYDMATRGLSVKLEEFAKTTLRKQEFMERLEECRNETDVLYRMTLHLIASMNEEDYVDIEKLQQLTIPFKSRIEVTFETFKVRISDVEEKVEQTEDLIVLEDKLTTANNKFAEEIDILKKEMTQLVSKYASTAEQRLARSMRSEATVIEKRNELEILKLPVKQIFKDCTNQFRHFSLGEPPMLPKPTKTILLVGMTGAGKSLMINTIANYIYGVEHTDDFRFKLVLESEELKERSNNSMSMAESMTRWVSSYTLHHQEGSRIPFTTVLIDNPGFGDTEGMDNDDKIVNSIKALFTSEVYPIKELSSICLVVQASQARLTAELTYVFNAIFNIFGKDVVKNFCILFTFADAQDPPALEAIKATSIFFPEYGMFKFNNSAAFANCNEETSNAYNWNFGYASLQKFFLHIGAIEPTSLILTKQVLGERETLHILLGRLQENISDGFETLQSLESTTRIVMELKGTMEANKDYKVKRKLFYSQSIIYNKIETEETIEGMMDRYRIALSDKNSQVKLLLKLLSEYREQKDAVFSDIQKTCEAVGRLEEIALGKSVITSVAYVDKLIHLERLSNRPNKENKLKQLEHFKEIAKMLSNAKNNPDLLTDKMSQYEKVVMDAIQKMKQSTLALQL